VPGAVAAATTRPTSGAMLAASRRSLLRRQERCRVLGMTGWWC
jgi:hypothetical protein